MAIEKIVQDMDKSLIVMRNAANWLEKSGKKITKWWKPENLNKEFLLQYTKPEEYYVLLVDDEPAASVVIQYQQNGQDWKPVDKGNPKPAYYVHWGCVTRKFAGTKKIDLMINFAEQIALSKNIKTLRADNDADEIKLREMCERLGFHLVKIIKEDYRNTALYEKELP